MTALEVQVGSTLVRDGRYAVRVTERRAGKWAGIYISLRQPGITTGTLVGLDDGDLDGFRHTPFEWQPVAGDPSLLERYAWGAGCRWLRYETRQAGS